MKNNFKYSIMAILFVVASCTKQNGDVPEIQTKELSIPFEQDQLTGTKVFVSAKVKVENGLPKFVSEELIEQEFSMASTGKKTYGYFLKNDESLNTRSVAWSIRRGYAFTGSCFEYGTLIVDDNGNGLFYPCGSCSELAPICPNGRGEWAAVKNNRCFTMFLS